MELCKKKNNDGLWMDELAAIEAYSHSEFPYLGNSGIILSGEDNDHSPGIMMSVDNHGLSSIKTDGSIDASALEVDQGTLNPFPFCLSNFLTMCALEDSQYASNHFRFCLSNVLTL